MKKLILILLTITAFSCDKNDDTIDLSIEQASAKVQVNIDYVTPQLDNSGTVETEFRLTITNNNDYTVKGWPRFKFKVTTASGSEILDYRDLISIGCTTIAPSQTCTTTPSSRIVTSSAGIITSVEITEEYYKVVSLE